jgi:hypothetical protein
LLGAFAKAQIPFRCCLNLRREECPNLGMDLIEQGHVRAFVLSDDFRANLLSVRVGHGASGLHGERLGKHVGLLANELAFDPVARFGFFDDDDKVVHNGVSMD